MRKAIGQQLRYLARNLKHIEKLKAHSSSGGLKNRQFNELKVIKTLFEQQSKMHKEKTTVLKSGLSASASPMSGRSSGAKSKPRLSSAQN